VKNGKAAIVWDDEFRDDPNLKEYIHCSPWLVKEGIPWPQPKKGQEDPKNARTFILTDMKGHWAVGIAKRVGLSELAHLLVSPNIITEFTVKRALNLDGGPSSGMWLRKEDGSVNYTKPGWAVRNGIAIIPR
jgi:exopolysaccharide biosynthesis protein